MMADSVLYASVRVDEKGIAEFDHGRCTIFIPMEGIRSVMLVRGSPAERPKMQCALGLALLGAGIYFLVNVLGWWFNPEPMGRGSLRGVIVVPFFLFMGGWLIYTALRRHYFLLVSSEKDRRKIVLRGDVSTDGITDFIVRAQNILGMEIRSRVNEVWDI